jgi:hypothetical protein
MEDGPIGLKGLCGWLYASFIVGSVANSFLTLSLGWVVVISVIISFLLGVLGAYVLVAGKSYPAAPFRFSPEIMLAGFACALAAGTGCWLYIGHEFFHYPTYGLNRWVLGLLVFSVGLACVADRYETILYKLSWLITRKQKPGV